VTKTVFTIAASVLIAAVPSPAKEPLVKLEAQQVLKSLRPGHPRLFLHDERIGQIKDSAGSDPLLAKYIKDVIAAANWECNHLLVSRGGEAGGERRFHRRIVNRAYLLGLAWRLTGQPRYARYLKEDLLFTCGLPDWHPGEFLNTAEIAHGVAVGYDWLYEFLDPEDRERIASALLEKGVEAGLAEYRNKSYWTRRIYNWNNVCNGGLTVAALAIADEYPDKAGELLRLTINGLPKAIATYDPDGAWAEGITYWNYATRYTVYGLAALETALGTDFGLSESPGLAETACFPEYVTGPTGLTFNFADAAQGRPGRTAFVYWLARRYNRPEFAWLEDKRMADRQASPEHVMWYWKPDKPKAFKGKLDKFFGGIVELAAFRSSWDDPDALFVCIKTGHNRTGHAQLDLGTFVMDALGVRWAMDLGKDMYRLPGYFDKFDNDGQRWTHYRCGSLSHNVPLLDDANQEVIAGARMLTFRADAGEPFAVMDLSPAYKARAHKVRRGLKLVGNRRAVVVQDEFELTGSCQVAWAVTTDAEISPDGPKAVLTKGGKELVATILAPSDARFTVESAEQQPPEARNEGVRRLMIRLPDQRGQVTVCVLLSPVWPDGRVELPTKAEPLSSW